MRITDSIYVLAGVPYGQMGNAYAVVSKGRIFLIDTGKNKKSLDTILNEMKYHRIDNYPVTYVLLTHMHYDHSGNAWYFREQGAVIISSEQDASGIEEGGARVNDFTHSVYRSCKVDQYASDGDIVNINGIMVESYLMPGHTDGSLLFRFRVDGKDVLCTGDTIIPASEGEYGGRIGAKLGWKGSVEFDPKKYKTSVVKACGINADILLAGHGCPVMQNTRIVIAAATAKAFEEYNR